MAFQYDTEKLQGILRSLSVLTGISLKFLGVEEILKQEEENGSRPRHSGKMRKYRQGCFAGLLTRLN